ncbi:MAG: fused MFS/spermidine synthase [Polyangiales bacterium]|nr:fused MFS/spermidine synthase [Myxococcales bacterium]
MRWIGIGAVTLSALLLFVVEPMVVKLALPVFGGSAAVWTTALVFFQLVLLLGYSYSYWITTRVPPRVQAILHVAVVAVPFFGLLPVHLAETTESSSSPFLRVFTSFTLAVGAPLFALATTSSIAQVWLARITGRDPAFLYAWSNAGSLAALALYPLVIEPRVGLGAQTHAWTFGYATFVALMFLFALGTLKRASPQADASELDSEATPQKWRLGYWIALAAVPSLLLTATSTVITVDLASFPLVWVAPLAMYLLTFVLAFSPRVRLKRPSLVLFAQGGLVALALTAAGAGESWWHAPALTVWALFFVSVVAHSDLAKDRPSATHLPLFYACIALGGVLGSLFGGVIAPLVFDSTTEYPIALCLGAILLAEPRTFSTRWKSAIRKKPVQAFIAMGVAVFVGQTVVRIGGWSTDWLTEIQQKLPFALLLVALFAIRNPVVFAVLVCLVVPNRFAVMGNFGELVAQERSFYGITRVYESDNGIRTMVHGTTWHGMEDRTHPDAIPSAYYHPAAPIAQLVRLVPPRGTIAVVGLGTGTISRLATADQSVTFYEIDPTVVRIAQAEFGHLRARGAERPTVVGDARFTLRGVSPASLDLLVIDAFASDTIPAHLLTKEAIEMYVSKLKPTGVVGFHISNRYIDLTPVLRGYPTRSIEAALVRQYRPSPTEKKERAAGCDVVAFARTAGTLDPLRTLGWEDLGSGRTVLWTDDLTSIIPVLR